MPLPEVFESGVRLRQRVRALQANGRRVGFVPTMGALHEGHLSLVDAARQACDAVVVSIFVNPTQFGPHEDFERYPRTFEADLELLATRNVEYVLAPSREEMYPPGYSTFVEPPAVAAPLEGHYRPGHFRGVATVVLKLFQLVPADMAFLGHKDYQQALVIQHMTRDLNLAPRVVVCPTVREADGLAMSSRNRYLSPGERKQALALSRGLAHADELRRRGERDAATLRAHIRNELHEAGIERIDYVAVADPETLAELSILKGPAIALVACHVGTTRLIDNLRLDAGARES